ncbi:SUMF1/EgtB/PvdO family nonheme iron enzyme [Nitrosomonadaceae bacterium]|nr:SUMF1/EgtB/PvdO family nonheme iron enzyme [Nitrosomonadaceae bacterium]
MSQFNNKLDKAQNKQKRIYILSGLVVTSILLLIAVLIIHSRGTRIEVMPLEAGDLATIRAIDNFSFNVGNVVYSLSGNPIINVSSPGFKDATKTIAPLYLGKNFSLELAELPGHLVISIVGDNDNLSETVWKINSRDVMRSAMLDLELEAGIYTVNISNPFFLPKDLTVAIKRQKKTKLQVDLQLVSGRLNILTNPSGAKVFLNEKLIGKAPLESDLSGGVYSLRVSADSYVDSIDKFEITHTELNVKRNYQLARTKAEIIPKLTPEGGKLIVNGSLSKGPLFLSTNVDHQLIYMKQGYYPSTKKILLTSGQKKEISLQLKPEFGKVMISSSPPATIWINNKSYGNSPMTVSLPAVTQQIVFKKKGHRLLSKTIKPTGKFVQKVAAKLLTEYQARLQESPRELTNKEGIKLKLFINPGYLKMGAPRSQKGQRANEFQKKIRLTKSFYASIFEITNGQYGRFKPSLRKSLGADNIPVTSIDWNEAASFCNWLSKNEGLQPFYNIVNERVNGFNKNTDGYRLLSEAEWEWLSRQAGKAKQTIFSWGDEMVIPPNAANVSDEGAKGQMKFYVPNYNDGYVSAAPVGSFKKELSGLYDIAGNVSEWVHDIYSTMPPMEDTTSEDPFGAENGPSHVVKGANFRSGSVTVLRPSFREGLTTGRDDVGFRVGRYLYGGKNE